VGTPFGLRVEVTLKGNFDRALRGRHLRRAAAVLVLTSRRAGVKPTVVATLGSRKHVRTLGGLGPGGPFAIIRAKTKLTFYVANYAAGSLASIRVKTIASTRRKRRVRRGHRAGVAQSSKALADLLKAHADDSSSFNKLGPEFIPSPQDCEELRTYIQQAQKELADLKTDLDTAVRRYQQYAREYRQALVELHNATPGEHKTRLETQVEVLKLLRDEWHWEYYRLTHEYYALRDLLIRAEKYLAANCPEPGIAPGTNRPPVINTFTAVFGAGCSTCTRYTVGATDPEGGALTYAWSKSPPPGAADPAATDCGTFDWVANQATWNHPNGPPPSGCSHPALDHPGYITVVVKDPQGATASFTDTKGSADYSYP
jgi:hypothetical protein